MKKIAIIHNYLDNIGGAEVVTLVLARELNADVYTTNIDDTKIIKMGFGDILPRINSIGKIPINAPFKQQAALIKFHFLNLKNKYDLYIICGDWAISAATNNKPNLWYVHSPIRELWDSYKYTRNNIVPWPVRPIFDIWVYFNRILNIKYAKKADKIACNSKNTQNRLKKFLGINNVSIINPPIETNRFHYNCNGNYWLSVNRLVSAKRIDIQLNAFRMLPAEKLIIVGSYEKGVKHFENEKNRLEKITPPNVEFKSWVSEKELIDLYANCKGFITTAIDEDFGMTPVEAMAAGKAVIAPNEGGYKETVINNKTGLLIDDIDENKLAEAIIRLGKEINENPLKFKNACQEQANKFDLKIFIQRIKEQIK